MKGKKMTKQEQYNKYLKDWNNEGESTWEFFNFIENNSEMKTRELLDIYTHFGKDINIIIENYIAKKDENFNYTIKMNEWENNFWEKLLEKYGEDK